MKVLSATFPEKNINLVEWLTKHQVGVQHTSLNFGSAKAVESEQWT